MALYNNGNPVSGLNSIPRLTLAQYNALNIKPEFWVRTDAPESYKKLSADQVSYDSNNTVKDIIDSTNINYSSSTTRFFISCPLGVGSLEAIIPFARKPTSVSITSLKIYMGGSSWTDISNPRAIILDNGLELTGNKPSGIQDGYVYWGQAEITAQY